MLNNPINSVDPTGQYVCGSSVSKDECANFQAGLDRAQGAANNLKAKYGADSNEYKSAQRAIDAYGQAGVDNGVVIQVSSGQTQVGVTTVAGTTVAKTASNPTGQNISVSFKTGALDSPNTMVLALEEAHEGSHVADGSAWVGSGFSSSLDPTLYKTEYDAFHVTSEIADGLGQRLMKFANVNGGPPYVMWNSLWSAATNNAAVGGYVQSQYHLSPTSKLLAFHRNTVVKR